MQLPLLCLLWPSVAFTFNLDLDAAVFRLGPPGSWFGFSLAAHFRQQGPSLLVGAPKAESGQPGTFQAGAVFACEPGLGHHQRLARDCGPPLAIEYPSGSGEAKRVPERPLHREGKNQQLLGFSVHSSGLREPTASRALACAPLLRWGQSAYTDGVCYLLGADLNHTGVLNPCETLPKKDRHNDYGACEQGFSAYLDNKVILTGLPGARKWTGGVFAKYDFLDSDGLLDTVDRRTMEVDKDQGGILALLASHDYLGYSVLYGHFGFWHEEENRNFTVVSGATRFNQTGAVLFLPFRRNFQAEDQRQLGITEDHFLLTGRQLGSGFGSSLAVLDLNADGFDDLVVGAPFEYANGADKEELGGAVYVFYSRGARQPRGASHLVFLEPIVLRGRSAHSQFGAALSRLGNLDNDPHGFQDFCVGAPQADRGRGEIFIFHGGQRSDFSTEPTQRIQAADLRSPRPLLGFGFSLAGGVDLDGDGYAELAVGAPGADAAVLFPAKPVLDVRLDHRFGQKYVKIEWEGSRKCAQGQSCFSLTTSLLILDRNQSALVLARAFPGGHQAPFLCRLEVLPFGRGIPLRAMLSASGGTQTSWTCGSPQAIGRPEERTFQLHIPKGNQDWTSPLRFNFSLTERRPSGGGGPALNPAQKFHIFDIAFDKDCGEDNECHTDLALSGTLLDLSRRGDGLYQAKVTERDALVLRLQVENRAESAFLAKLFLRYDETELDEPRLVRPKIGGQQQQMPLDVERREKGLAVVALGNPLKAGNKLSFDLLFKLVRGSSERISTSLRFEAQVNSSSFEQRAEDNRWEAEVQLIKEADLQLAGTSRPPITHFSRGNAQPIDELDIGTQVVHAFTLTNRGPFYARNISVLINWPLQLHSGDWLLYTLEEPLIRHNGHFRRCGQPKAGGAVNPLGVYNDETLKLDYPAMVRPRKPRQTASGEEKEENVAEVEEEVPTIRTASILGGPLLPKSVRESSGEWVRVVDINCKDGTARCVQLDCHFDYIGANDSALIEVRARLWNWTFSAAEDYRTFDYVAITSEAFIEVDPAQGILEDVSNNFAQVTSHAYPDRPQQEDRIELWLLLLAVLIGLLLLAILVLSCWLFGFFRRKRPDLHLHQAYYQREREESVLAQ